MSWPRSRGLFLAIGLGPLTRWIFKHGTNKHDAIRACSGHWLYFNDSWSFRNSRMRSEGSRFTLWVWGWGCVRQKLCLSSQPSATVGNSLRVRRKALHSGEWCRKGSRKCDFWPVSLQLFWRLQRKCLWVLLCRRSYIGVCRGGVSVSDLWRRS